MYMRSRAPQVTRERMYIETLQQILTASTKVVVDAKSNGNLLFLPLDRIMSMTGAGTDGSGALKPMTPEVTPPPESTGAGRSRDSLRARDRENRP
jgi:membrane protease subunit HflK